MSIIRRMGQKTKGPIGIRRGFLVEGSAVVDADKLQEILTALSKQGQELQLHRTAFDRRVEELEQQGVRLKQEVLMALELQRTELHEVSESVTDIKSELETIRSEIRRLRGRVADIESGQRSVQAASRAGGAPLARPGELSLGGGFTERSSDARLPSPFSQ